MDSKTAEDGTRRLLDQLREFLDAGGRHLVPHGFQVQAVRTTSKPNSFAPQIESLATNRTAIDFRVPVIWETLPGVSVASETPATDNLDELKALIELGLSSGEFWELRAARLNRWTAELPPDTERPSEADWSVQAVIRSI
jgi:hypothetical protein